MYGSPVLIHGLNVLVFIALVVLLGATFALGQSRAELCEKNSNMLADAEKKLETLKEELNFSGQTEDTARTVLSNLNKSIVDPQRTEPGHFFRELLTIPDDKRRAVKQLGLPWKDEYLTNDLLLLKTLRDKQIVRVDRVKYVLAHKPELQQQQYELGKQIDFYKDQNDKLGCGTLGEDAGLEGKWEAVIPNSSDNCTMIYSLVLTPYAKNSWAGALTAGGNCPGVDRDAVGRMAIEVSKPGNLIGKFMGQSFKATYTSTQIVMPIVYGEITFVRKQ